jgi:hypothetical protein
MDRQREAEARSRGDLREEDASEIAARGNGLEETSRRARGKTHAEIVTQSSASLAVVSTAAISPRPRE